MPSVLLTDQGKNFQSHLVTSMCQLFEIEKRRTTAYHPQTDGLCERFNAILKSLLRMRVNKDKDDWDGQLPHALLAYRVSKQSSTGVSPFEMLYGRVARLPLGVEKEELQPAPTHGPAKYLEDLNKRQTTLRKLVMKRIEQAQEKQKRNYDKRYRAKLSQSFYVGDTVLLKNFRARGLDEKYTGPYLVVGVREQTCSCELESLINKNRKVVHWNNLKHFTMDSELPLAEDDIASTDSEYDIDEEFLLDNAYPGRDSLGQNEVHREEMQRPYNLRRNRRQPERYGVPVADY